LDSKEQRQADHSLIAHEPYFQAEVPGHFGDQRNKALRGKIHVANRFTRL
jgi:hypothetical protein